MDGIHELFERWNAAEKKRYVVATLLAAKGHSYRKPGAVMLFGPDGAAAGSLSPGCLEQDLAERAETVRQSGELATVDYDMESPDDPWWGDASYCGGAVTVLLEPLEGHLLEAFLLLRGWIDQGREVVFNRIFDHRGKVQAYRLICKGGASKRFGRVTRTFWTWSVRYGPKPRTVIFGWGGDVRPAAELAVRAGFRVTVADWKDAGAGEADDGLYERIEAPFSGLVEAVRLKPGDRVLIMSHRYRQDRELLEQLLPLPVRYIGILGSAARAAKLLEGLSGASDPRIHAPVGLPIGAAGPEQIAVSIVGELIADNALERLEKQSGSVRTREDGMPRRNGSARQPLLSCTR